jgi:hypothetical protein
MIQQKNTVDKIDTWSTFMPESNMSVEELKELGTVEQHISESGGYITKEFSFISFDKKTRIFKTTVEPM